jgi:hypothetical protein
MGHCIADLLARDEARDISESEINTARALLHDLASIVTLENPDDPDSGDILGILDVVESLLAHAKTLLLGSILR